MKNLRTVRRFVLQLVALFFTLTLCAFAQAQSGNVVISSNTSWVQGSYSLTSLTVNSGATLTVGGGSTVTVSGAVVVTASSNIVFAGANTSATVGGVWKGTGVSLSAASIEVDAGSTINADGQGYVTSAGPGGAPSGTSAAGSYGGPGGTGLGPVAAAAIYGSANTPTDLGSGGGVRCCGALAGNGGGAIALTVSGTLTNNGVISANGAPVTVSSQAGAGSGGSVYITTGGLDGSGSITANGGASGEASGGGGRIAVYYNGASSTFTGFATSTASAGPATNGGSPGANGTAAFFDTSVTNNNLNIYQDFPLPANANLNFKNITVNSGAVLTIGGGTTVTVANELTVSGTIIPQSANNTAQVSSSWQGVGVTIKAASIQVNASGAIDADGQGYIAGAGPGAGAGGDSEAGSYGGLGGAGYGGAAAASAYGSPTNPVDLGSGGNTRCCGAVPGAGGGAITLSVSGTLTNNGVISSNGSAVTLSSQAGGGSGGSVNITAQTLAGSGSIAANGGEGGEATGGGGRIALLYSTNDGFNLAQVTANGGMFLNNDSGNAGARGTVYILGANTNLTVNDGLVLPGNQALTLTNLTIGDTGTLTLGPGTTLTAQQVSVSGGSTFTVGGGSTLNVSGQLLVTGNSSIVAQSANNAAQVNGVWAGVGVTINAPTIEVDAGSSILADGQGYVAGAGPGAGAGGDSEGGSYGGLGGAGYGGASAAPVYGSSTQPVDLGSGGNTRCCDAVPGAGGGAITLTVTGTLTNNGIISANGAPVTISSQAGGGAGGTVSITTGTLTGTGSIAANGGAGGEAGGGGGRVAVYYTTNSSFNLAQVTANGGSASGGAAGAAGTVYTLGTSGGSTALNVSDNVVLPGNETLNYSSITVNNQGSITMGPGTTLNVGSVNVSNAGTFTIGGGSVVTVSGAVVVTGNSGIVLQGADAAVQVNGAWKGVGVTFNAASVEIDAGSSINADGQGYLPNAGPGGAPAASSAGGSYGGLGGAGLGPVAAAAIYGSANAPTNLGSGGGSRCCGALAGNGGGAIILTVTGTLTNNGVISANGAPVTAAVQAGAGAGGSVYITTKALVGSGSITANGGTGGEAGGGGGRVAVYYNGTSSTFTGFATSTATGGAASNGNPGVNGTAGFFDTSVTNDNLNVYQDFPLAPSANLSFSNITVNPGAVLTVGGGTTVTVSNTLTVNGTLIAQSIDNTAEVDGIWQGAGIAINAASLAVGASGAISADSQGYVGGTNTTAGAGPGGGPLNSSAGGSYGGLGGAGYGPVPAAPVYGSSISPIDLGSGGGTRCCGAIPGNGGGAILLTVTGTLTNNGIISANGDSVTVASQAGGSAGGTVNIATGTLTGTGSISANGGAGGEAGGSGGRVAVNFKANNSFNLTRITANGGTAQSGGNPGAPGTVYTLATSGTTTNLTVSDNVALPANATLSYSSITVNNQGSLSLGSNTSLTAGSISISNGSSVVIGGGSTLKTSGTFLVTGKSTVTLQGLNTTASRGGVGVTLSATNLQVDAGSAILADGQGYLPNFGPGGATGGTSAGGSYGGLGGAGLGSGPAQPVYGSATTPADLGSGGGSRCCGALAGNGGGAMRLMVSGTLTDNGIISANGIATSDSTQAGGGSGGSVLILAGTIAGTGSIAANGGGGGEAGGGGGRIAVYYTANSGFSSKSIAANGGGAESGGNAGSAGTIAFSNTPLFLWVSPADSSTVLHGNQTLQAFVGGVNLATSTASFVAAGPETLTIGSGLNPNSFLSWDTTTVPDGRYQLTLNVYDGSGNLLKQVPRTVVINNSVAWHSGILSGNQEWTASKVQGLDGTVVIPAGVTVTIDPGTVVKALPGAGIVVQSGGILNALGGSSDPVIFTTFDDSSVGGDTDFNNGQSLPSPGEWNGISVQGSGQFNINSYTDIWYGDYTEGGTLSDNATWLATQLYEVTSPVVVPSGVTLTIQPGAIVKFGANGGINVQAGGHLIAQGTVAQPVYFTSMNDNSIGGASPGSTGTPAPGDWTSISISGTGSTATFDHVQMLYGSGPSTGQNLIGMIQTGSGAVVNVSNTVMGLGFWNGFWTGSTGGGDAVNISNSVVYGMEDRGIDAWGGSTVNVVNSTFDGNNSGIQGHGGNIVIANTVVSNSVSTNWGGVDLCGGGSIQITYSDVWTSVAGSPNYACMTDQTGTSGNISSNPEYVNLAQGNYRLGANSPLIDAASGTVPNYPLTDALGDARFNDPQVTHKTGVADINGNYPDIGAYEFVESAVSNIDLTVPPFSGPSNAVTGTSVELTWTDSNIGSGTAKGPWHDAIYLVQNPDTNPVLISAGEVLVASGVTLGPGQTYTATGTVRVPGAPVGNYRWEVITNDRGEVFVGQNSANASGLSVNSVALDLPQLEVGSAASTGAFSAAGQSWWYKMTPGANQTVNINLMLSGAAGSAGAVQLFVGQGYVPTPQHYDIQQVEFNSPTASLVIPSTTSQTYYVTAFAQSLTTTPAAFTIAATAVKFSLTSVTPNSLPDSGTATLTFTGGGFTSSGSYELVGSTGTVYHATSVFVSDSTEASVTFNMAGVPPGGYTAEVVENGATASLKNAVTVTTTTSTYGTPGAIQVSVQSPPVFRVGFPAEITLSYANVSGSDQIAPIIWLSAVGATIAPVAPECSGCNANFQVMYQNANNSGVVLGINNQGPAGVLPAGAQGSVKFTATPTGSFVTFTTQNVDPNVPDSLIGYDTELVHNPLCPIYADAKSATSSGAHPDAVVCNVLSSTPTGVYANAAALCSAYLPPFASPAGFSRTCMQFLNTAGFKMGTCYSAFGTTFPCGSLDGYVVNKVLAADATALSQTGIYDSDGARILGFELENDGQSLFDQRYHQGAFGFGTSHQFDITAEVFNGAPILHYPDGSSRPFPTVNPNQANQYLGMPGDYGVLTVANDGTWSLTESNGIQYNFAFDSQPNSTKRQLLSSIQDLAGNTITLAYTNDLVTSAVDSYGNTISFVYDSLGHITQSTDPVGRVTTYTYDIKTDSLRSTFLTSVTNSLGTTTIAWNEGGPSGVGYFDDSCVTTYCEPAISIKSITYPDGTHANFTYDALGRLASRYSDLSTSTVTFSYDGTGGVSMADAAGNVTKLLSDVYGSPSQIIDPLGAVTQLSYDPEEKLSGVHEPMGSDFTLSYDALGNAISQIDPLGNEFSLAFGAYNNLLSFTEAAGDTSSFAYDNSLNLTTATFPDSSTSQRTFDGHGNVTSWTNRRGHTTSFTYNAQGLMTSKTYSNGSTVSYTYDGHQNLLTAKASNGTTAYTYDSADRLSKVSYPSGQSIQYTYNAGSQLITMTDSTGFTVHYGYDAAGRLTQLTNSSNALIVSYTYNANGTMATKTMGNGTTTSYTYDAASNLLHLINYSATHAILSRFDYVYDSLGRPTSMTAPSGSWTYGYDANSQITSVTAPTTSVQYTYDANGNRLTGAGNSYNVNSLNEYTSAGANSYTYDADGNLLSGGGWTYTYDDDNQLIGMTSATDTWTYQYDGLGNRIASTHNGVQTQYLIDPSGVGNVEAEFNSTGQLLTHYTFGVDLTSSVPASGTPAYYHFDGAGNTAQITNSTGAVVNNYSYLPFGEKVTNTVGVSNPFTYVGEFGVMDEGSGSYFMRNRWYIPALGRFMQPDPLGLGGGDFNLYRYVGNTPTELVDITGLDAVWYKPWTWLDCDTKGYNSSVEDARQELYNGGQISESPQQRADTQHNVVNAAGEQTVDTVVTLTAPEVHLAHNPVVNLALNKYGPHKLIEKGVDKTFGIEEPKEPGEPGEPKEPNPEHMPPEHPGPDLINPDQPKHNTTDPTASSKDPNGKISSGYGDKGFIPPGTPIVYTIFFENTANATAPAEKVVVTDPLAKNLDWTTVELNQIEFNNVTINVPTGQQSYVGQVNVSTDPNPVNVKAALNPSTGILTWTMQSVDATTGGVPANPLAGFLPPNNSSNQGAGYVTFTVKPKSGLANGTTITNQAAIVFDVNASLSTNTVTNTIDSVFPTSAVNPLPASSKPSFLVSWTGKDSLGAGIAGYTIFVSIDGGRYSPWLPSTAATSATYKGVEGQTYSFYSIARDNTGLTQQTAEAAQTTTVSEANKPKVTAKPSALTIAVSSPLSVAVAVKGYTGYATPTGTVTLTSGKYKSTVVKLTNGAATIKVPELALAAGEDTLTITYTPDSVGYRDYVGSTALAKVTVTKARQTLTFPALKSPEVYGVKPIVLSAKASSKLVATFKVLSGPAKIEDGHMLEITGAGTVIVEATQAGNVDFLAATPIKRTIVVDKAKLIVKVNNLSMIEGAKVPALTYEITGFVDKDTQKSATTGAPSLSTSATSSSKPGTYAITAKQGTLKSTNYGFTFDPGTLTVKPK